MEPTIEQFKEDVKTKYLVINRVSPDIRDKFIKLSNEAFCGDYGQLLKFLMDQTLEYQFMKQELFANADIKLNYIIQMLENKEKEANPQNKGIKLMSGKILNNEEGGNI